MDPVAKHLLRRCQLSKVFSFRLYCRGLERGVLLLGLDTIKAISSKRGSVDGGIPRELLQLSTVLSGIGKGGAAFVENII